jgi:hypothetical protein
VREREKGRKRVGCVRERERREENVCEREKGRKCLIECVCVCARERERERDVV